jgi:hypothetical protein
VRTRKRAWHVVFETRGKQPARYTIYAVMPHTAVYQVLRANPEAIAFAVSVVPLPGKVSIAAISSPVDGKGPRIANGAT